MKTFVYGVVILEWIQTGLTTAAAFDFYVHNFGNVPNLLSLRYTWFSVPVMTAIASVVAQMFFAWRVYKLGESMIMPVIIITLALCQCGGGIAGGVQIKQIGSAEHLAPAHIALGVCLNLTNFIVGDHRVPCRFG